LKTFVTVAFFAFVAWAVFALLRRFYRWVLQRRGKPFVMEAGELNEAADEVAKTARVIAAGGFLASSMAAPTGLAALGLKIGIVAVPLVVWVAPHLAKIAGFVFILCCVVSLYAKRLRRKGRRDETRI
jgi:membrane protein implicated in regulation of membrane protease activity